MAENKSSSFQNSALRNSQSGSMIMEQESESESKINYLKTYAYRKIFFTYKGMDGRNEWDDSSNVKKHIRKLNLSLKINDTIAALIGCGGLGVAWYEAELSYESWVQPKAFGTDTKDNNNPFIFSLRLIITASTIALIVFLYMHSHINWLLDIEKGKAAIDVPYHKTKYLKNFILESILYGIHTPPSLKHIWHIEDRGHYYYLGVQTLI